MGEAVIQQVEMLPIVTLHANHHRINNWYLELFIVIKRRDEKNQKAQKVKHYNLGVRRSGLDSGHKSFKWDVTSTTVALGQNEF